MPPPLPPRKSSPTHEPTTTIPTTSNVSALRNGVHSAANGHVFNKNGINEAQSVTNLSQNAIEIPQISKSNSMLEMHINTVENNTMTNVAVELSSPETIYGVVISNCDNIIDSSSKSQTTRHLSCPSSRKNPLGGVQQPVKSNTSPNISHSSGGGGARKPVYENVDLEVPPKHKVNPLVDKNSTVAYENLNMDYIKKLVSEGYSKDAVIKALGITRNNVDMACDILHEFGTKLG